MGIDRIINSLSKGYKEGLRPGGWWGGIFLFIFVILIYGLRTHLWFIHISSYTIDADI